MAEFRVPTATYRVQFSLYFRFLDGRDLVPYLHDLGITDLYSSPRFKARRGSPHAYDVANPLKINSELGTEEEFQELADKLKAYGMGLMLDIVPNHMAASPDNPWWMDVLENGRYSLFAPHFAIDWDRISAKSASPSRVVLPILGDVYGAVLESAEFSLKLDENGFYVRYYEHRLPLDPKSYGLILAHCGVSLPAAETGLLLEALEALPASLEQQDIEERHRRKDELKRDLWRLYNSSPEVKAALDECLLSAGGVKGDPKSFDLLDRLLSRQHYRVAYWRMAFEELNYRRFFDITDLVGVRVEDPRVFYDRHPELFGLVQSGAVTGMRVDHIDGLWNPHEYLERLREGAGGRFYSVVEKILGGDEELPRDFEACGTTGYDFLNYLNGLFVDPAGIEALGKIYRRFTGIEEDFTRVRYRRKKQVIDTLFAGEVHALGFHLGRLAAQDRFARDLPFADLIGALLEVTAWFPIYRTYIHTFEISDRDRKYIEKALELAQSAGGSSGPALAFIRRVLLLEIPHYIEAPQEWLNFVMDWQQFTGPAMAKGFEDTACYTYNRLVSQNEVGSDPELADRGVPPADFHRRNLERLERWPYTMNATSTHDTKRSEDVRARINVLSEITAQWGRRLVRWSEWNERRKQVVNARPAPDRNDEMLLYQTLIGIWPMCNEDQAAMRDRLKNYLQKALREEKVNTSWLHPNEEYENACLAFVDAILEPSEENLFLKDFLVFEKRTASAGAVNALAQVLLKITSPGLPDFYQGTELWDLSLVDPDNRRPVDFTRRAALLDELKRREAQDLDGLVRDLLQTWQDGRIKLYLTYKALNFRRAHPELFQTGEYLPVETGERVCCFARRSGNAWALVLAPRLSGCISTPRKALMNPKLWGAAEIAVPPGAPGRWHNIITGERLEAPGGKLPVARALGRFPVGLFEGLCPVA